MAIDQQIRTAQVRFGGLPGASDRTRAIRSAKRHSALVKLMRWLFPVLSVCVTALYFLPMQYSVPVPGGTATIEDYEISDGGLKMVNPRIKGVHEKYGVYDIRADHALQQATNPELMNLNVINADVVAPNGQRTVLTAPSGIFHSKKEELTFDNGVVINGDSGMSGRLKTATAFMKDNLLVSKDPVDLAFHNSTIKAQSMTYYSNEGRAVFEGSVKVHLERKLEGAAQ
jgi:lipopolysaccharide export system protein LptC